MLVNPNWRTVTDSKRQIFWQPKLQNVHCIGYHVLSQFGWVTIYSEVKYSSIPQRGIPSKLVGHRGIASTHEFEPDPGVRSILHLSKFAKLNIRVKNVCSMRQDGDFTKQYE